MTARDTEVRAAVRDLYRFWLDDDTRVPPELADWSYGLGMHIVAAAMAAGVYDEPRGST